MLAPWSDQQWDRYNDLQFVEAPPRVPFGDPYHVELEDKNGRLPELVQIYYWFDGQDQAEVEPQSMKPTGQRMVHSLPRATRAFKVRAVGGDGETDWVSVEVVEPPRIESLTILLHPPAYTAWPNSTSSPHIDALVGTTVAIAGRASEPLAAARVAVELGEKQTEHPLTIGEDGRSFALAADAARPWTLETSGTYRVLLEGIDGVVGGENDRHQIDVRPDAPPRISVTAPDANTLVTADASVPILATIRDDLAIQHVELRYSRSDNSDVGEQAIVLYEGPPQAVAIDSGDSRDIKFTWQLAELGELPAGASLLFTIAAADYRPQEDQCPPRRITIITRDQLEDRIAQRQTFILGQLAETLEVQRDARSQTAALQVQFEQTGQVAERDVVDLQSAELNQRRVDRMLAGEQDGVLAQIDALLEVVAQNRLDNPDLVRRMHRLRDGAGRIVKGPLPEVQRNLLTGLKAAQNALAQDDGQSAAAVRQLVDDAATAQDDVITQLKGLLGNLSQWDSYRRFSRQVSSLRNDQQALTEQTGQMRLETLSKNLQQLSPQEKADLAKLALRQTELARRLESLLTGMEQMQSELGGKDPLAAETLADAVELARSGGLSGRMRRTSQQIGENRLGQATGEQQQVGEALDELLDTLTGRREHELSRQLDKLKEASDELRGLQEQAKGLREKMEAASQNPIEQEKRRELERLKKDARAQQEQMRRLERKLERLRAEKSAESLARAAESSQRAGEAAEQGNNAGQQEQSDLEEQHLQQAQEEIAQQIKQAEQDLLDEQIARLEQVLDGLIKQQQSINDETLRLDDLKQDGGVLTRGQLGSVRTLAQQQHGLMAETNDFAEKIKAAEVFHLALSGAVREMTIAAESLEIAETGERTQRAQAEALRRLEQLVTAMKDDDSDEPAEDAGGGGEGGNQGQPPDGIANIAELKLLRLMQESLRERTSELAKLGDASRWTAEQQAEVIQLAKEQGKLADLMQAFSEPADDNPADDPDALPDLPGDDELEDLLN